MEKSAVWDRKGAVTWTTSENRYFHKTHRYEGESDLMQFYGRMRGSSPGAAIFHFLGLGCEIPEIRDLFTAIS